MIPLDTATALAMLAPHVPGYEPPSGHDDAGAGRMPDGGPATGSLYGRRFRLTVEWEPMPGDPDPLDLPNGVTIPEHEAERERARDREARWERLVLRQAAAARAQDPGPYEVRTDLVREQIDAALAARLDGP